VHELGHIRADHEHRFPDYATSRACRGQAEIEAESIAYLVTAQAGLDTAGYSVPYLAGWSGGDIDLMRESMSRVISVSRDIGGASRTTPTEAIRPGPASEPAPTARCSAYARAPQDRQTLAAMDIPVPHA